MAERGILTVVSGFSGAGKGTLMKELLRNYDGYALSISATTRSPREGEEHGREYFFLEREAFEELIETDRLLEHARYQDNYYGTPRDYVEEMLEQGFDVILEIEVQGGAQIREKVPDALLIFVTPPSAEELRRRLVSRGTETTEKIRGRLLRAEEEAEYMPLYDAILVNDDLDTCVRELHSLIRNAHMRSSSRAPFISQMKQELKELNQGGY